MSDFVYLIIVGKLFLDCFGSLSSMTQYHKMIGKKSSKKKICYYLNLIFLKLINNIDNNFIINNLIKIYVSISKLLKKFLIK